MYRYETELYKKGINYIAGIDEAGRGPICGPVVAACVLFPKNLKIEGLTDSKKLSKKKRNFYFSIIKKQALGVGVGIVDVEVIDKINILEATKLAMKEALNNINHKIDYVLIDAVKLDISIPNKPIIKGDAKSISIAAASVIAKVTRDRIMDKLDKKHPEFDFKNNKGYPTKYHKEAIEKYGILKEHRKTFKPVCDID